MSRLLAESLASVTEPGRAARVLDCGGGSGRFAVPLARAGGYVTVVDISADALATLRRRAEEAGVAQRVDAVQGDIDTMILPPAAPADSVPGTAAYDLVLAHGVLGAVEHLTPAFAMIASAVRPGGLLSVLVANPVAGVLARALAGDLPAALAELRGLDADPGPLGTDAVQALCRGQGLQVEQVHGIGVFSEFVRGQALEAPGAREALDDLESESRTRTPFCEIAARVHLLARRPAD